MVIEAAAILRNVVICRVPGVGRRVPSRENEPVNQRFNVIDEKRTYARVRRSNRLNILIGSRSVQCNIGARAFNETTDYLARKRIGNRAVPKHFRVYDSWYRAFSGDLAFNLTRFKLIIQHYLAQGRAKIDCRGPCLQFFTSIFSSKRFVVNQTVIKTNLIGNIIIINVFSTF